MHNIAYRISDCLVPNEGEAKGGGTSEASKFWPRGQKNFENWGF